MTILRSLALLVMGLSALSGCSKPEDPVFICSANTCTGCCNGNDCVTPPDETACGTGGAACAPCRANEACNQGKCVPDACGGCVDPAGLSCLPGTASTACGVGGAFCAACGASTVCNGGKCVSDACAGCKDTGGTCQAGTASTACGSAGETCKACTGMETCQDKHCTPPAACNATTCPMGCCDNMDQCQMGNTTANCGAGGNACQSCTGTGATCTAGVCKTPCGPGNCAGCCDTTGACVASINTACGINGVACAACTGSDICSSGKCISTACKSTCGGCCQGTMCQPGNTNALCGKSGDSCGPCVGAQTTCQSGVCHVDPNSLWDFVVASGQVPERDKNNVTWDSFGGLPDPLVELDLDYGGMNQSILFSDYVGDTTLPDWSSTTYMGKVYATASSPMGVKASLLLQSSYLQVYDYDPFNGNDDMGFCVFTITEAMFNGSLQTFTCASASNSQSVSWTLKFRIVPHT